jgi:hypothetical protein
MEETSKAEKAIKSRRRSRLAPLAFEMGNSFD